MRTSGYAWYMAALLSFAFLLSILDRYLLGVVIDAVKSDLELTDTQLGFLLGPSFVIMFLFASIPFGWLADVSSRKWTIAGGLLCWSVATAWCGLAENFTELAIARLFVGLGEAALLPSALSLIAAYFSPEKLNRGIAIFSMGSSFGRASAFAGGGALFAWFVANRGYAFPLIGENEPWQLVFITAGLVGIVFTALFILSAREPVRITAAASRPKFKAGFVLFWQQRWAYLAIFIPHGMTAAMGAMLAGWAVAFYTRNHGLDVATASSIVGFTGLICGPIGHLLGGWLNDFLHGRGMLGTQPYVLAVLLTGAASFAAIFALSTSSILAACAYGLSYGMLCAAGPTSFGGIQVPTPEQQRGVISSIFVLVYNAIGNGLGPLLVGIIGDSFFPEEGGLGPAIAASLVIVLAVALPFALFGRPAYARAVREQTARQAQLECAEA